MQPLTSNTHLCDVSIVSDVSEDMMEGVSRILHYRDQRAAHWENHIHTGFYSIFTSELMLVCQVSLAVILCQVFPAVILCSGWVWKCLTD